MRKIFSILAAALMLLAPTASFEQTVISSNFSVWAPNRTVNSGWWIEVPVYLYGVPGQQIEGVDCRVTYPYPMYYAPGGYVATWQFPGDWWYAGNYVSPAQDSLHFAMVAGSQFSFNTLFLGYFSFYVGNLVQGQTVRLGISLSIAEKVNGKDTLVNVAYSGGYISGGPSVLVGDADNDGSFTVLDPIRALEISTGQYLASFLDSLRCDVSGDGQISSYDGYEMLMHEVYPWWTFEVLGNGYSGAKGNTLPAAPGSLAPIAIQLNDVDGGVEVSFPDTDTITCADLKFSSAIDVDQGIKNGGMFQTSSDSKKISFASENGISGRICFVPNAKAQDLLVTGSIGNGMRITVVRNTVTSVSGSSASEKNFA